MFFIERAKLSDDAFVRVAERLVWAGMDGRYDVALDDLTGLVGDAGPNAPRGREADDADRVPGGDRHPRPSRCPEADPAPPDRAAGAITGGWDRAAASSA